MMIVPEDLQIPVYELNTKISFTEKKKKKKLTGFT